LALPLVFEAEACTIVSGFTDVADAAASGGHYMRADAANAGELVCPVQIPTTGTWKVQALIRADNSTSDSFCADFVNAPVQPCASDSIVTWHLIGGDTGLLTWDTTWRVSEVTGGFQPAPINGGTLRTFELTAGVRSFILRGRDANTKIDKIAVYQGAVGALEEQPTPTPTSTPTITLTPTVTPTGTLPPTNTPTRTPTLTPTPGGERKHAHICDKRYCSHYGTEPYAHRHADCPCS
jgi:hypothetical protein